MDYILLQWTDKYTDLQINNIVIVNKLYLVIT